MSYTSAPRVSQHSFAMVPKGHVPRSRFNRSHSVKTTFDAGYIIPFYLDEVLPGDDFQVNVQAFGRLATPIVPIMDNAYLDVHFFFVPNRLVWENWDRFNGERRPTPTSSIDYTIPLLTGGTAVTVNSIFDYYGLPLGVGPVGNVPPVSNGQVNVSCLPFRGYNLIYNEWYRDQNLIDYADVQTDDDGSQMSNFTLLRRAKRHDYFTSALPWPQKIQAVSIPFGGTAPVTVSIPGQSITFPVFEDGSPTDSLEWNQNSTFTTTGNAGNIITPFTNTLSGTGVADLSSASAATINLIRMGVATQQLLELDARGGTRYTEIIQRHFGVLSPDARLQRPEYLGGGTFPLNMQVVAQTSGTGVSGQSTPQGNLSAFGTFSTGKAGFRASFTEHGYVHGFISCRADLNYDRGIPRHFSRRTRYDYYLPVFANLGEQAILNKEIFASGGSTQEELEGVFGYQERWAEYRYHPNRLTGLMRTNATGSLSVWHFAQAFTALPALNQTFIEEKPPFDRVLAVGSSANGKQLFCDISVQNICTRPLPTYSVPGLLRF